MGQTDKSLKEKQKEPEPGYVEKLWPPFFHTVAFLLIIIALGLNDLDNTENDDIVSTCGWSRLKMEKDGSKVEDAWDKLCDDKYVEQACSIGGAGKMWLACGVIAAVMEVASV